MRKTTALLSASTLGVVAVAAGAAVPASADIITEPRCDVFGDHLTTMPDLSDPDVDWFMACVPQYGVGKAEFTLDGPDVGFPDGFDLLTADSVSSPDASGLAAYYGDADFDAWVIPFQVEDPDAASLRVIGTVFAPVTSVGRLDETPPAVAEACEVDAAATVHVFVSYYAPVTTTFSVVGSDGVTYSAPVTLTPDPTYYVVEETDDPADPALCVTDSSATFKDSGSGIGLGQIGMIMVPPYVWFAALEESPDAESLFGLLPDLGTFAFAAPAPQVQPQLAATGAENVLPLAIGAGVLGVLGTVLFVVARRRRTEG